MRLPRSIPMIFRRLRASNVLFARLRILLFLDSREGEGIWQAPFMIRRVQIDFVDLNSNLTMVNYASRLGNMIDC